MGDAAIAGSIADADGQWVAMINEGQEAMITRDDMYRLTQINEAALESNQRGIRVVL